MEFAPAVVDTVGDHPMVNTPDRPAGENDPRILGIRLRSPVGRQHRRFEHPAYAKWRAAIEDDQSRAVDPLPSFNDAVVGKAPQFVAEPDRCRPASDFTALRDGCRGRVL